MTHTCDAIVITCIDFRFQDYIEKWQANHMGKNNYDRVAFAGGVFDLYSILKQVEISVKLHHIKKATLINHEDCGAYGVAGTYERHKSDLIEARRVLLALYPQLEIETYYLHLDGYIEKISAAKTRVKKA